MALVACTAAGAICAGNAPDERQRELAPIAASFEKASPCPFYPGTGPLAARLVCGYLEVPERHERADGPHIALPVVVIRSASASPRPDPVVFLHGGPGAAPLESSATIERFASHPFSRERDIILYNQRGSLQTRPALACDTFEANRTSWFTADLTLEQRDARIASAVLECLRQLRLQGRDVGAYDARENAADLLALRRALGITQWNVLAVSYGTWMAQVAATADPRGVRSLILDSIMSPTSDLFMSEGPRNFSLGLDRLLAAMEELKLLPATSTAASVLVVQFAAEQLGYYQATARQLRAVGIGVEVYPEARKLGQQLSYAEKKGFKIALIAGPDEVAKGIWQVKDLAQRSSSNVNAAELVATIQKMV